MEFLVELDVTSTGLFSIFVWFLFPVLSCCGEICCVALRCNPLCCVALRSVVLCLFCCVAIRCVAVVLYLLSCIVLRRDPLCRVALCCVALLTSSAFLVFRLC